ncbi:hypothetical protein [Cobetia crustatorum]|uniref:hypothetical protein n=1 Tax=Cobetia crustatorum TaxID=553385 RepID=UPI000468DA5D|nr:hypothetical protein [Cobetia crustatorum]
MSLSVTCRASLARYDSMARRTVAALMLGGAGVLLSATSPANAAHFQHTQIVLNNLGGSYGFIVAQDITLSRIAEQHPELQDEVRAAATDFDNAFPNITQRLTRAVESLIGREATANAMQRIETRVHKKLAAMLAPTVLTTDFSQRFLEILHRRAEGDDIPSPYREYLLATTYQDEPVYELYDGYYQQFSTKGHAKSRGVDLTLRLPASWGAKESRQPHIVQKWRNQVGTGMQLIVLEVYDLDGATINAQQLKVMQANQQLSRWAPQGSEMLDSGVTTINHRPGYWFDISMAQQHKNKRTLSHTRQYGIFINDKMVRLSCSAYQALPEGVTEVKSPRDRDSNSEFESLKTLCGGVIKGSAVMQTYETSVSR